MARVNQLLGIDFETYYDAEFSLRRMSTPEYILDERFQVHGAAIRTMNTPPLWLTGQTLTDFLGRVDWRVTSVIGHNLAFDGAILAWHYGVRPKAFIDTLGMSRFVIGAKIKSHSLGSVYEYLTGLPGKQKGYALIEAKGVRTEDMTPAFNTLLGQYACDDIQQTWGILLRLLPQFPATEIKLLDWVVKMATNPTLHMDAAMLAELEAEQVSLKDAHLDALAPLGITRADIMSNAKLGAALTRLGCPPPTKVSERLGTTVFDMSKGTKAFTELGLAEDNFNVQQVVAARLDLKSTLLETRARTLQGIVRATGGTIPIYLNYAGAMQTRRLSSGQATNIQNLPRGSLLRKAIHAPAGHVLLVADLSNIELRTCVVLADQRDKIEAITRGEDLYCNFGSKLYGRTVTKADKKDRTVAKVAVLSLQYQSGHSSYQQMLWAQQKMLVDEAFARSTVALYRHDNPMIVAMWKDLTNCADSMSRGNKPENPTKAPLTFTSSGIVGPRGFTIKYPNLRYEFRARTKTEDKRHHLVYDRFSKDNPSGVDFLYGGVLMNNINQHLAAEVLNDMVYRYALETDRWPALQVHDELVYVVPENEADDLLKLLLEVMHRPPTWWPDLPVAAEGGFGYSYGDIK